MDRRTRQMLVDRLRGDARRIARRFGLRYRSIEAERANVTSRYGQCTSDGAINIRLRHAITGRPLKYSSLVNTLCHELAHLRHFDHSERFKAFYFELLAFARAAGIYRPAPVAGSGASPARARAVARASRPVQLALFETSQVRPR